MKEISSKEIFEKYQNDTKYKANLGLYEKVEQQENFFIGRQWEGLNAPDLEKPVINVTKRVTNYLISVLLVNDVGISFRDGLPTSGNADVVQLEENNQWTELAPKELEKVQENVKFREKMRHVLRDAAVTGDAAMYTRFIPAEDAEKQDVVAGHIETEIIDGLNVHFGDKQTAEVQKQPWIIVSKTELTKTLKEKYPDKADEITADGQEYVSDIKSHIEDAMTTVCIYFWRNKDTKTVWYIMCTENCILAEATDTGLTRYPVSWMNWERVKDSYHGIGVVEEVIPNQIAINKLWAMSLLYTKNTAFPKIVFDKTKIDKWTNRVGAAIGVSGNPNDAIASVFRPADLPGQVLNLVNQTITYTKEFMGANDAALGNVNPENTSAIIRLQQSSAAPLELQRLAFYQFIEDWVRTVYEIMHVRYGIRYTVAEQELADVNGQPVKQKVAQLVDFSKMPADSDVIVDIGASDYWSEITQTSTMDNLFSKGILQDAITYVESVPDKNIKNKAEVIDAIKRYQQQQRQQEAQARQLRMMGVKT